MSALFFRHRAVFVLVIEWNILSFRHAHDLPEGVELVVAVAEYPGFAVLVDGASNLRRRFRVLVSERFERALRSRRLVFAERSVRTVRHPRPDLYDFERTNRDVECVIERGADCPGKRVNANRCTVMLGAGAATYPRLTSGRRVCLRDAALDVGGRPRTSGQRNAARTALPRTTLLIHEKGGRIQQQAHDGRPTVDPPPPVEQRQHGHGDDEHVDERTLERCDVVDDDVEE